jgi:hypothetical protein
MVGVALLPVNENKGMNMSKRRMRLLGKKL